MSRRAVQPARADCRISKGFDGKLGRVATDISSAKNTGASKPNTGLGDTAKVPSQASHGSLVFMWPAEVTDASSDMDSRAMREQDLACVGKVEADEAEGNVIDVVDVNAVRSKLASKLKTWMPAVASEAKSRIPHLSADDVGVIDDLVREAFGEMVDCPMPSKPCP
ncbi:hypothetical protein [Ralstonia sp. 24A2]|uniref:hypothetical protein n=1 Tax=Ralstonia sp. 24A2 TaxID=3447364 RepID=UPI003F69C875